MLTFIVRTLSRKFSWKSKTFNSEFINFRKNGKVSHFRVLCWIIFADVADIANLWNFVKIFIMLTFWLAHTRHSCQLTQMLGSIVKKFINFHIQWRSQCRLKAQFYSSQILYISEVECRSYVDFIFFWRRASSEKIEKAFFLRNRRVKFPKFVKCFSHFTWRRRVV